MSAANIVGKSKKELYDIMCEMKKLMEQNEEQARQILIENPTLARDLFHAQIMLGMVQPMSTPTQSTQASPSHAQQSAPAQSENMDPGQNMDTILALPANPKANSFMKRDQGQKKDIVLALPAKSTANSFTTRYAKFLLLY
nr:cleavage stimulating factor 64 [Ipomoea batatas]